MKPRPLFSPTLNAILLAFAGFGIWTVCDAIVRYLRDYSPLTLALLAATASLCTLLVFSSRLGGITATFQKPQLKLQWLRGLILALSGCCGFFVFTNLELAQGYALVFVAPILAKLVSVVLNREHIRAASWLITAAGFAGVLIVLRPGVIPVNIGALAALTAAGLFAVGYVMGRFIGEENQTALSLSLFLNIGMVVLMAVPGVHAYTPMPPAHILLALSIGVLGAAGELLVSLAYARAPAAFVAPVHYTQIIWGLIWGIVFFGEYPDAWTMAGAGVIIAAGIALIALTRRG